MAPLPTELRQRETAEVISAPPHTEESGNLASQLPDGDRKCVGVNGYWYDVTDFLPQHPGGPILSHYVGQDATEPFTTLLHKDVLKHRKPVGTYKPIKKHPADEDFAKIQKFFQQNGYFDTSYVYYVKKISVVMMMFMTAVSCVVFFDEWYMHYMGAVILAFFWQQTGFCMHDFMHGQVIRTGKHIRTDRLGGLFFGTVGFGFSAHWWQGEHIIHHALTNTVDSVSNFADPQMWESVWAQNETLFPLFSGLLNWCLIKIQHITFIPAVVFCGRVEILLDSYRLERRWYEWIAIVLHWSWMVPLLSALPTWRERAIFYFIAASVEGIFHFQLILSHYCKKFLTSSDFHHSSWYVHQIESNMNIDTPWWQDWYYGGLNYHIEHHLFPKLARNRLREAGDYIKAICIKHGVEYDMVPFSTALTRTLSHLKVVGKHYKLDPR